MQTNNKMAVAPVGRLIWQMSIPPLISMFLQYSYNLIDSAFIARLSENALTAVSLSFPITTLMNAASIWIGVGVNVLIAGYLGEKKQDEANTTVTHGLLLAFGIGALLNLLSLLIMKPYFGAFTNNEEIYQLSIAYMSVCSFMQIPNMVHIAIQKMIQATGNMVAPMWFQIAGVVVNFVFDPLLIFGIGIFPAMGIRGAAVATVAGYLLSMILAFALLLGKKQKVRIKIKGFHLQKWLIGRIFTLGLPSFIMNALSSFMVTFVNFFLVAYSDTAIAFFGAYFKVQQLIVMTVNGLIQGCLPIMRFNYGAGNRDRLHSAFRYGTALVTGMMILGTLAVILFPAQILGLFTASEAMRSFGISAMQIMAVSYLFCGWSTMISTYLQATEQAFPSMLIQLLRQFLLLIPFHFHLLLRISFSFYHNSESVEIGSFLGGFPTFTYTTPDGMRCRDNKLHEEKYCKEVMENEFRIRAKLVQRKFHRAEKTDGGIETDESAEQRIDKYTAADDPTYCDPVRSAADDKQAGKAGGRNKLGAGGNSEYPAGAENAHRPDAGAEVSGRDAEIADGDEQAAGTGWEPEREVFLQMDSVAAGFLPVGGHQVDHAGADPWHGGTGRVVWRGGDPRPVPLMPAVAGLAAAGMLLDEDEDAEEKRRRMEAKIAAENFGAVVGLAAGAALAVKEKLDEQTAQEEQKKQQHEQMT